VHLVVFCAGAFDSKETMEKGYGNISFLEAANIIFTATGIPSKEDSKTKGNKLKLLQKASKAQYSPNWYIGH
jgi:hypothetical protein